MSSVRPHVCQLPPELLETILKYVDLDSMRSLRLTCHNLARDCLGPHFLSFVRDRKTDLSRESLAALHDLAVHPILGRAVRKVAIEAPVYGKTELESIFTIDTETVDHTPAELVECEADLIFLRARHRAYDAFASDAVLAALTGALRALGTLDTLGLYDEGPVKKRVIHYPRSRQATRYLSSRTFNIVMVAIARSGVAVENFLVFHVTDRFSVQSVDITRVLPMLEGQGFATAGRALKRLVLQVSTCRYVKATLDRVPDEAAPQLTDEEKYGGVASFLELMPGLETLDLQLYSKRFGIRTQQMAYDRLFHRIADTVRLPMLRVLRLRGIQATEEDLLAFWGSHTGIVELHLQNVRLTAGSWTPVVELIRTMPALEKLHLCSLFVSPQERIRASHLLNLGISSLLPYFTHVPRCACQNALCCLSMARVATQQGLQRHLP